MIGEDVHSFGQVSLDGFRPAREPRPHGKLHGVEADVVDEAAQFRQGEILPGFDKYGE